ncbi:Tlg2-vesicle protein of 38 kDa [Colletotrichum higginsianum IMI 349063]|uniref:Golgi apparatus membrane protein TVP38 n=1 Tax=Colletotrichum higginsianum (strain IMI 349063) TaxID=759273 RepID=A0A1B7YTU5_COLHI|nr:Tlg2-vesicle protein of 38 kDa [Colletotrichum higginsianum IMI 349063]OBR15469.1 Tlg2-vesicle protein of 38 kDa [Colletotrichum higginsianum IMI 349063]GJC92261.1 TLG2-vesicle protein of 38 kDa [Colletotrichum higginsianum]
MPADYVSAARALSLSPNPPSSPSEAHADVRPPWIRNIGGTSGRRLSANRFGSRPSQSRRTTALSGLNRAAVSAVKAGNRLWGMYLALSPVQRVAVAACLLALNVLIIVLLVYSHAIFQWLGPVSEKWRALPGGWLIIWAFTFLTAFPPMIGYSSAITISGFVYGFPLGYPIVATATVAGSLTAFYTSRGIFSGYVHRLVGQDHRFIALGQVLRKDGLGMLTAVRFCPLPYSLSNGFLSTIPTIKPWVFAASTALASPKLLVHVFIGSRLALIAEKGDEMTAGGKAINYISMVFGGVVGLAVGWVIYQRTMARAAELALEEAEESGLVPGRDNAPDYSDVEAGLVDPEDVAALMDEDDISLWAREADEEGGYRDYDDTNEQQHEATDDTTRTTQKGAAETFHDEYDGNGNGFKDSD